MDDDVRGLERAWRRSGALDDEARWLAARARAGDLDPARLALAGHAGHPAAALAVGAPIRDDDLEARARRLLQHSAAAFARALVAVARLEIDAPGALERLALPETRDTGEELRLRALLAAEAWVACPCARHARQARADAFAAMPRAPGWAASYAGRGLPADAPDASLGARWHVDALVTAGRVHGDEVVRLAIGREVGDWLLGARDAVADGAALRARLPGPTPPSRRWPAPSLPPPPGVEASG